MELEEAIIHAREVAEGCSSDNRDCAYQHDKLADWLEELKLLKKLGPCGLCTNYAFNGHSLSCKYCPAVNIYK